jgi:ubiquinone/menaquinone biosynthesis C-methylase UbiE
MRRLLPLAFALAACGSNPPPQAASPDHHHDGPLVHRFERADEWAKVFDDPARDAWQRPDDVVAELGLAPGMTVADVGAGTGYFESRLARAVGPSGVVIAEDIEPDMVRYLRDRATREGWANMKAVQGTTDDPALPAGGVDRVLIVDVWHHVPDRRAFAAKLAAALKPGGQIHIVDFTREAKHGPPPMHRLDPAQIVADLAAAGLDARVADTRLPEQYIVVGTRR